MSYSLRLPLNNFHIFMVNSKLMEVKDSGDSSGLPKAQLFDRILQEIVSCLFMLWKEDNLNTMVMVTT